MTHFLVEMRRKSIAYQTLLQTSATIRSIASSYFLASSSLVRSSCLVIRK
jgi:hypothetical protein